MAVYRREPMAAVSGGWRGVFFCCFGKQADTTAKDLNNAENHNAYGATAEKKPMEDGKGKTRSTVRVVFLFMHAKLRYNTVYNIHSNIYRLGHNSSENGYIVHSVTLMVS